MPRRRSNFYWFGEPEPSNNNSYAYRKNVAMLLAAGVGRDQIKEAVKDLYVENGGEGVYLDNNEQKVWVKSEERKGFEIYARKLKITAIDDSSYWGWRREIESLNPSRSVEIQVVYLKKIKWLEVRGHFSTLKLTANTKYNVSFILKTQTTVEGSWNQNQPVTFRLNVPNHGRQEKQLLIENSNDWKNYPVGEFDNNQWTVGTIQFQMEQLDSTWKYGLVIKGVRIEPV